jgi:antitoxin FitA
VNLGALLLPKMIQIRNVPDALHRRLKARAAMAGMSPSDYLLSEIRQLSQRPTLAEFVERLRQLEPVAAAIDTARIVREGRDER